MNISRQVVHLKPLPFALPDIGEPEIAEVVDSLRSGWITTGPKTARFEAAFSEYLGGNVTAIAVNSATAGLHLAIEALSVGPGDEVIVPVHTFTATAEIVRYVGANPVFVDVEPASLTMDPACVERAITPRTKAIIPVHYAGLACDMAPLIDLAKRHGLAIVEDAAHALPTTYYGELIGTLPTAATVFSFYATKTLATGEGGMLVTRDRKIAERARVMRLHGISRDIFDRYQAGGDWYYEVIAPGFKYNMTDIAAALGLHQLKRVEQMRERRESIAGAYSAQFADLPLVLPAGPRPGDVHSWHLFPVRLDGAAMSRNDLVAHLKADGIGVSVHYVPLHLQPYWRETYALREQDFPVSTAAYRASVSLPIYNKMDDADVSRVVSSVRAALG
jgi:dTDP-4-amino-4,6-dideoxygalactose transaminase